MQINLNAPTLKGKTELWLSSRLTHGAYIGGKETSEHSIWRTMLARCRNVNSKGYAEYGGRGISVCARWDRFENFLADMGERPSGYTLDRIDTNGDYEPSNCRWASRSTQQKNKRTTRFYTDGVFTGTLTECAEHVGISKELAHIRFKQWGTFEKDKKWQELPKPL